MTDGFSTAATIFLWTLINVNDTEQSTWQDNSDAIAVPTL